MSRPTGGPWPQFGVQLLGVLATVAWSAAATWGLVKVKQAAVDLHASETEIEEGLDLTQRGERIESPWRVVVDERPPTHDERPLRRNRRRCNHSPRQRSFCMKLLSAACLAVALVLAAPAHAQQAVPQSLDFLAGNWTLHDASGAEIGRSRIEVQSPGAMLFEQRTVGDGAAQPIWFENSEKDERWVQLFIGAGGQVREFATQSTPGAWPIVMGGDVTLRDGTPAKFRLTIARASDDETRRVLEMSRDHGVTWTGVFDYTYRRTR